MTVEEAGALAAAVKVTVALHVGMHGLFVKAEAVTPVGRAVRMLSVKGEVPPQPPTEVTVAVSTPPASPAAIDNVAGVAARVKSKNPETTRVNVAVWVTAGVPPLAWIVITADDEGAQGPRVRVTEALQVGLQGLLENADAATPEGRVVRILKVRGEVEPDIKVAVAVSTPP